MVSVGAELGVRFTGYTAGACFIFTVCFLTPLDAVAETKKPVSKWTCDEFLAVESDCHPRIVYFTTAKAKVHKSYVYLDGTEKVVPLIIGDC